MNARRFLNISSSLTLTLMIVVAWVPASFGQNTSSVFSPDVDKGESELEYRAAFDPEDDAFAHRLHYQYGFTDWLRMRAIVLQSGDNDRDLEYRYFRWETQFQFLEDQKHGWDSAVRFELQIADGDDPPSRVRLAWTGKVDVTDILQLRGNLLTGHEFGNESDDGFLLEARAQVSAKLTDKLRLAVDYYGDMNNTESIGGFDDQEHQLGPLLKFKTDFGLSGNAGVLFGLSEAAPDTELRVTLIYAF